jgi:hypothetical protein
MGRGIPFVLEEEGTGRVHSFSLPSSHTAAVPRHCPIPPCGSGGITSALAGLDKRQSQRDEAREDQDDQSWVLRK